MDADVAIAGGGPVGLALAVELGQRGVSCVVVEPRARTRMVPRAKLVNVRTMEHMRRWRLADELRAVTPLPASYSTDISFVTHLVDGHELVRFHNVFNTAPERDERFAEPAQQVPQYVVEPVLRRHAEALEHVRLVTDGWHVDRMAQDDDGVDVVIVQRADGSEQRLRARYLVGCDGAASRVRELLGVEMLGRRSIARNFSIVFRSAELKERVQLAPALHFWTVNELTPSFMGPGDRDGLWWLQATRLPEDVDIDRLDPHVVVRGALGAALSDVEIVGTDPWEVHELVAERVRDGRVFLAGDAAHLHSPMGAHGMNQGVGDAVDLGWKLAAVLEGWAGEGLLDSYAAERQPFHRRAIAEASHNYATLSNNFVRPDLDAEGPAGDAVRAEVAEEIRAAKHREFNSLGLVLGHCYEGSPAVLADGTPPLPEEVECFTPRARPGARIPHGWLSDGSSLFDRLGRDLTLLTFGDDGGDAERFAAAAAERGVPLTVVRVDEPAIVAQFPRRLALVRPDQVLAWHGAAAPPDLDALLDVVTGRSTISVTGP